MKKTLSLSLGMMMTLVTTMLLYSFEKEDIRFEKAAEEYVVVR